MRDSRSTTWWGYTSLRIAFVLLAALPALAATTPAHAAAVSMTLRVSAAQPFHRHTTALCPVSVAAAADGVEVLRAAKASGCIGDYTVRQYPGVGNYVACINGICDSPVTYWRMAENGKATSYGVDGFRADAGDELEFSYTTWAGCLASPQLC